MSKVNDALYALGYNTVAELEDKIRQAQEAATHSDPIMTDVQYDILIDVLKQLAPQSEVLAGNWETESEPLGEYDAMSKAYGIRSIRTITDYAQLDYLKDIMKDDSFDVCLTPKLNGHMGRAVYVNGKLVEATSRGRTGKGRDLTAHMKQVLPVEIARWRNHDLVEIRYEMVCPIAKWREVSETVKTPLSAITSALKDTPVPEEMARVDACSYNILSDSLRPSTLTAVIDELHDAGLKTPIYVPDSGISYGNLTAYCDYALDRMAQLEQQGCIPYDTDGVVVAINDRQQFYDRFGLVGKYNGGNFALKMGPRWAMNHYKSVIRRIVWMPGKINLVPKAEIEPTLTRNGTQVTYVPLHNVGIMIKYGFVPGADIYFRYGGETGVSLTTPDGQLIGKAL